MKILNSPILEKAVIDVLKYTPYRPFLCLPLSALLYVILKDKHGLDPKLTTGNLKFKEQYIFKQDFKITDAKQGVFTEWAGHAWVEIENVICDLSFFRTLYSAEFKRLYKRQLVDAFGEGRGCLIFEKDKIAPGELSYQGMDFLEDETITAILKGFPYLNPEILRS